jgi:hypothetical protein
MHHIQQSIQNSKGVHISVGRVSLLRLIIHNFECEGEAPT